MNRIHLRLFSPNNDPSEQPLDEFALEAATKAESFEDIIPISRARRSVIISGRIMPAADRARLIRQNGICPECGHPNVEPLELADSLISARNRLPVPGTATIVGFHCNDCGSEWPVYELTSRKI